MRSTDHVTSLNAGYMAKRKSAVQRPDNASEDEKREEMMNPISEATVSASGIICDERSVEEQDGLQQDAALLAESESRFNSCPYFKKGTTPLEK